MKPTYDELLAQRNALAPDAERYRWLKANLSPALSLSRRESEKIFGQSRYIHVGCLDSDIDEAMAAEARAALAKVTP
jgi:hypothetical protein